MSLHAAQAFDDRGLERSILAQEEEVLRRLDLAGTLAQAFHRRESVQRFATSLHFIRNEFSRHCFIVGGRCPPHERYWGGLARNLVAELGGGRRGISHNDLFRRFLRCVGIEREDGLEAPSFATAFTSAWQRYCEQAPWQHALAAMAVYEVLDQPDFALMLAALQRAGLDERGLLFFRVHAKAEHLDFFTDVLESFYPTPEGREALDAGRHFVMSTQEQMWRDLMAHVSEA